MKEKKIHELNILIFLGFLFSCFIIQIITPQKTFSESENRYLQKRPKFTLQKLVNGKFAKEYDSYMSDQFPGRNQWVMVKVLAERFQGKRDVNDVYFGSGQYLIEKLDIEDLVNEQLEKNLSAVTGFTKKMEEQVGSGHIKIMIVPGASQVMSDRLPAFAAPYNQSNITERLKLMVGADKVVPVEQALQQHHKEPLYYKTDHHWTSLGAFYGYQAWADEADLTPWSRESFEVVTVSQDFLGTVYSKLNVPHKPDSMEVFRPLESTFYRVFYDGINQEYNQLYNYDALAGKDKYSLYLDGNHGLVEIRNEEKGPAVQEKRLLIIRDSFAHTFAPFAVNHFEVTYLIDLRYFNLSTADFIRENKITDLLILYQIPSLAKEQIAGSLNR